MNRVICPKPAIVVVLLVSGLHPAVRFSNAQTCNCSCDSSIPATLDVLKVFRNEGPGGPTGYVTAGRGSHPCHNTEIGHANLIDFGGGAIITDLCVNLKYPSGMPGDSAIAFIAPTDPNNQNLPGPSQYETTFPINVTTTHMIVHLPLPQVVNGLKWVGIRYPTAECFTPHQGVGTRNQGRAAVYIKGPGGAGGGGGWRDYDSTQSSKFVGKAPLIRPMWLVPAAASAACDLLLMYQTNASGMLQTTEPGGRATVSATLSRQPSANVSVLISSTRASEGIPSIVSLTFTPSTWNIPQAFDVVGVDDALPDGPVNYRLNFLMTSSDPCFNNRPVPGLNCVNLDDETSATTHGGQWTQVIPPGASPSGLEDPAMVFDTWRGMVVMFGGQPGSVGAGETWEWDGSDWRLASLAGPISRHGHALAYDEFRRVVVLSGGETSGGSALADTWEWDGKTWAQRSAGLPNAPGGPRVDHAMTFDPSRGVVVLYGGDQPPSSHLTWEWSGTSWQSRNTASYPAPRSMAAMTYDTRRQRVILFGGQTTSPPPGDNDVWEYDGTNWTMVSAVGIKPSGRSHHGWAHDPNSGVSILFGGETGGSLLGETWEWDGVLRKWTQTFPSPSPAARTRCAMVVDLPRGVAVAFGGSDSPGAWRSDTWKYVPIGVPGAAQTRYFQVNGFATGNVFAWSIMAPNMSFVAITGSAFPPGQSASGMVALLASWVTGAGGGQLSGTPVGVAPNVLAITTSSTIPYAISFGTAGAVPGCSPSPSTLCAFNPTITELLLDGDDCNANGIDDVLDIANDPSLDANDNKIIDACDLRSGDVNCDGVVDLADIPDFVQALLDPGAYTLSHSTCSVLQADTNLDGAADALDLQAFVLMLM